VIFALVAAALGASSVVSVDHQLRSSLDTALRQRAKDVARLSVSAPALLTAPGTLDAPQGGRQLAVEVVDRGGIILARSASLGGRLLPGATPLVETVIRLGLMPASRVSTVSDSSVAVTFASGSPMPM